MSLKCSGSDMAGGMSAVVFRRVCLSDLGSRCLANTALGRWGVQWEDVVDEGRSIMGHSETRGTQSFLLTAP
jgi:hypothetical protein